MLTETASENVAELVEKLNFAEKVQRALRLIEKAYKEYGDSLVDAVWAKIPSPSGTWLNR